MNKISLRISGFCCVCLDKYNFQKKDAFNDLFCIFALYIQAFAQILNL